MVKRGPCSRPQASEGEAQHGPFCWTRRIGQGDERLHCGKPQREAFMIRLVTRGRLTVDYAKGLLAAPEDREPAVRKLIEGAGGKLLNFYFTTGDTDFLLVTEANDAES